MPNRAYAASTTSHGMGVNDEIVIAKGMPQKTMFRQLLEMGLDYRVYFQLVPAVLMFKDMRHKDARSRYRGFSKFIEDAAAGDLPEFTWIEPSYYTVGSILATDQHPDHDVSLGEALIKDVYDAVRNGPLWNKTALIITYDEHGGFFDHVVPPSENVPNPDGINSVDDPFDFTRLGVRIPTVVVSPWVKGGSVVHAAPSGAGQYEHSSLAATVVHKLFAPKLNKLQPSYLTKRDEWAATFESIFTHLKEPRGDCPQAMPTPTSHQKIAPKAFTLPMDGSAPLTDLQVELLAIAAGATEDETYNREEASKWTEAVAGKYIADRMNKYFGYKIVDIDAKKE
jgi:phospholipase C